MIEEKWNYFSDENIHKNIQFQIGDSNFVYNLFYKKNNS